jgi:hypothetical protein
MTFLGKTLLLLNFACSLILAVWSFTLYSNHIDWTDKPAKGDAPPGELARTSELLKKLGEDLRSAEAAWRSAGAELKAAEEHRGTDRVWYLQHRQHALIGATAASPVQEVVYLTTPDPRSGLKKGQIRTDPRTGLPLMQVAKDDNDKPLLALSYYGTQEETLSRDLMAVLQKLHDLADEDTRLTAKLVGDPARGIKGLHQRLEDERKKHDAVKDEIAIVKPLRINTEVESELIVKRKQELQARIKEVEKIGVASGPE